MYCVIQNVQEMMRWPIAMQFKPGISDVLFLWKDLSVYFWHLPCLLLHVQMTWNNCMRCVSSHPRTEQTSCFMAVGEIPKHQSHWQTLKTISGWKNGCGSAGIKVCCHADLDRLWHQHVPTLRKDWRLLFVWNYLQRQQKSLKPDYKKEKLIGMYNNLLDITSF